MGDIEEREDGLHVFIDEKVAAEHRKQAEADARKSMAILKRMGWWPEGDNDALV